MNEKVATRMTDELSETYSYKRECETLLEEVKKELMDIELETPDKVA